MANWTTPKTDWITNPKPPVAEDFNRIESNIQHVFEQVEAKKGAIVSALNYIDMPASIEDSYSKLANKIRLQKMQVHTLDYSRGDLSWDSWTFIDSIDLGTDLIKMITFKTSEYRGQGLVLIDFQTGEAFSVYWRSNSVAYRLHTTDGTYRMISRQGDYTRFEYVGNVLNIYGMKWFDFTSTWSLSGTLYAYR